MNTFLELIRDSLYSIVFHLAPRVANVILLILISRAAGPAEAGVFVLATTYLLIFTTIMRGMDDLIVRQVARTPGEAARYLTSYLLLRAVLALLFYGLLAAVARFGFNYAASTMTPVLILGLCLLPDSLTFVAQAVLLGQRRFAAPANILAIISLLRVVGGGAILLVGGSLEQIAWFWVAASLLGMAAMLWPASHGLGGLRWSDWFDLQPVLRHWRAIAAFVAITTMAALEAQTDTLLLSGFHGESEVGWYGAATTIAYSLVMFAQAYRFAVYPLMVRYALDAPEELRRLYESSVRYLGMLALPMVAGLIVLAPELVRLIFGSAFAPTIPALQIISLTLLFTFLNEPNNRIMLVHDRQNLLSLFLLLATAVNIGLNLLLTPSLGPVGAASARVASTLAFFLLNQYYVSRFLTQTNIARILSLPTLAAVVMVVSLQPIRAWSMFITIGVGVFVYVAVLRLIGGLSAVEVAAVYQAATNRVKGISYKDRG
jgi:O-antigen/teichoic acid export membrane protein